MALAANLWNEIEGSPVVVSNEDGTTTATRIFKVKNWTDWPELLYDLRGSLAVSSTTFSVAPATFPMLGNLGGNILQGLARFYCADVRIEPFMPDSPDGAGNVSGISEGLNTYASGARVTAEYKLIGANQPDSPTIPVGTRLRWRRQGGVDMLAVPGRSWQYASDGLAVTDDVPIGIRIYTVVHTLEWLNVGKVPTAAIATAAGTLNYGTFLGVAAGKLLFESNQVEECPQLVGGDRYNVSYVFQERSKSWNEYYRPDTGVWDTIRLTSAPSKTPYEISGANDFANLFV